MASINWTEEKPRERDLLKELAEVVRSQKTAFRAALEEHFYWNDSQASAGEMRVSTTTPGSARVFYGTQSQVSHPGRDGTMMITSDTSRALVFSNSSHSMVLGSNKMYSHVSGVEVPTDSRVVVAAGSADLTTDSINTVSLGVTYSIKPNVLITGSSQDADSAASYLYGMFDSTTTNFTCFVRWISTGADPDQARVIWRSVGTMSLT